MQAFFGYKEFLFIAWIDSKTSPVKKAVPPPLLLEGTGAEKPLLLSAI